MTLSEIDNLLSNSLETLISTKKQSLSINITSSAYKGNKEHDESYCHIGLFVIG
ncbi:hypothetical protein THO17_34010 [Marinomonas sp. THO17]